MQIDGNKRGRNAFKVMRALGFRFVFPIGTLPIPYHPLIAGALLLAVPAWLANSLMLTAREASSQVAWLQMVGIGLILGLPLSVPIVAWAMMVFRVHLIQALLFASAMILLASEVARGRTVAWLGVLPVTYVAVWLLQRGGGFVLLRRLRRDLASFAPIESGARTVVVAGHHRETVARDLVAQGRARQAYVPHNEPSRDGRIVERIAPHDAVAIREMGQGKAPPGWSLAQSHECWLLTRPAPRPHGDLVTLDQQPFSHPLRVLRGDLTEWRVTEASGTRSLVTGTAAIAGPLPLATAFRWSAIFGGKSEWVVGFLPQKKKLIEHTEPYPLALFAVLDAELRAEPAASPALITAAQEAFAEARHRETERQRQHDKIVRQRAVSSTKEMTFERAGAAAQASAIASVPDFWEAVAADPASWAQHREAYQHLLRTAKDRDREDLRRILNWLEAAIPVRARDAIAAAGRLLAAMEPDLLASEYGRIQGIFNSRVLGMVWRITPGFDVTPLPPRVPKFGEEAGYGLIRKVPELYAKLAMLAPEMEEIVARLATEALHYDVSLPPDLAAMALPPSAKE